MTVLQAPLTAGELLNDLSERSPVGVTPPGDWLTEDQPTGRSRDDEPDPIGGWTADTSALVLVVGDGKLFLLPSSKLDVRVPAARLRNIDWRQVIVANELGPLMGIPPVGAGGSRLFKAGPRLGVMLDAGRNPTRQPSVVYLDQLAARARDLGITEIRAVIVIHRHADHYNEIARVVREHRISPQNVIIPRAYVQSQPDTPFNASMAALRRIFGQNWRPSYVNLRPATPGGQVVRGRYTLAGTTFEFIGLASALQNVRRQADRASLLTRVSRQGEPGAMVVLGDLRGADLAAFHRAMGATMWRDFFRDVTTISGFSHHRGRLAPGDVPGIMLLLEQTLVRNGRLTAIIQTDPGQQQAARAETLEFMRRIGVRVRETHVATTARPSGVQSGMRTSTATGPAATTHEPVPSALTEALARIERLMQARRTIDLWGPHLARSNPSLNTTAELRLVDQGLAELRNTVRAAVNEGANVRVAGGRTAAGGRDYSGGSQGAAFQAAIGRIPRATSAETAIGDAGFAALARMRAIPEASIPLEVALRDALINGRFSRQAFDYLLRQLDPATRRSMFTGPRGGPSGGTAPFGRMRAEFGFLPSLTGSGGMSVAHLRGRPRMVARGVAGALAVVEIGNLVGQATQSYRISRATARKKGVAPFLRRIAFWRQLRGQPAAVAVDDRLIRSNRYERDLERIDAGLRDDDWDFVFIEHTDQRPALSDAEILQVIAVVGHNIRNYDEYATLFEDSGQDAVTYNASGVPWTQARWQVCVGRFETSGTNRVVERWVELPLLTEGMRKVTARVVHNTSALLSRLARGEAASTDAFGSLQHPRRDIKYKARLRDGISSSQVELRPHVPAQWGGSSAVRADPIRHRVNWASGAARPTFFVWDETQSEVFVSGADFPTYYRLRDLKTERYQVVMTQRSLNDMQRSIVGNEDGAAWLPRAEVVRI